MPKHLTQRAEDTGDGGDGGFGLDPLADGTWAAHPMAR